MDKIIGLENKGVSEIKKLCGKYAISPLELSLHLHLPSARVYEILSGKRGISISTDLRLAKFFNLKPGHFFALQTEYDFAMEAEELKEKLAGITSVDKAVLKRKRNALAG